MKAIKSLFLLIILSSCSTIGRYNSIRLVKVDKTETVVLDKKKMNNSAYEPNKKVYQSSPINETAQIEQPIENTADIEVDIQEKQIDLNVEEHDNLVPDIEDEDKIIAEQAKRAEKNANNAFFSSIAAFFLMIIPLLGLIPLIIGFANLSSAMSSRYITPFGQKRLRAAAIILIIDTALFLLWILLIVAVIFLF